MSNNLMSNTHSDGSGAGDLSALFDGQLGPDEARFALKRLGQDAGWREACGRWQLAGDALRGDGVAPAPTGFADRVMAAVEREQEHAALTGFGVKRGPVRHKPRWVGGALAASVAIAALLVARPMLDGDDPAADALTGREIVSTTPSAPPSDTPAAALTVAAGAASESTGPDGSGTIGTGAATAAMAAAGVASSSRDASRRSERRQRPLARTLAGSRMRASPDPSLAAVASPGPERSAVVPATPDEVRGHPFMADAIASRPWPRAAVPGFPANAGMTVGFNSGDQAGVPISFYPFEPATLRGDPAPAAVERDPPPTSHMLPEPSAGAVIRH